MPVFSLNKINSNSQLGIWKINETLFDLNCSENNYFFSAFELIKHQPIKLQKICTALLIEKMQPQLHRKILYTQNGKPEIANSNLHISISHNSLFSAVLLGNAPCGIDTEPITYKAEKIKHKFLSDLEIGMLNSMHFEKNETYTFAWCIKESIFKWYSKGNVLFKENIEIQHIILTKNGGEANVIFRKQNEENKNIRLHLQKIENCAFAYTI